MIRQSRKVQHIEHFLRTFTDKKANGFGDVHLVHDALSELDMDSVHLSTSIGGINLEYPVFINAITGGDDKVIDINRKLAACARKTGIAMAVGSQYAAIKNPAVRFSYEVVRKENPDGIIFANLGAYATLENAKEAVAMLDANALQIHLNVAQELFMQEGDRDFSRCLDNIKNIAQSITVPVIVKETGCGIAFEAAQKLLASGIKAIDVSGSGGTNFLAIETSRTGTDLDEDVLAWGIPTAISLLECKKAIAGKVDLIASGGITTALEVVKSMALGAGAVGLAGIFLKILLEDGEEALCQRINQMLAECRKIMLLTGSESISMLKQKPTVITGFVKDWLASRSLLNNP